MHINSFLLALFPPLLSSQVSKVLFKQTQKHGRAASPRPNASSPHPIWCNLSDPLFACCRVWLNSIFSLPCVIARAEFHFLSQFSRHHMITVYHISGLICGNVITPKAHFVRPSACFLCEAWLDVVLLCLCSDYQYWRCFLFATHLPSLSPFLLCGLHCLLPSSPPLLALFAPASL